MQYRILEMITVTTTAEHYKVIGDGFQSPNAVWLAVVKEVNKRLTESPGRIYFVFDKVEDKEVTRIGHLILDPVEMFIDRFKKQPLI
jgi:hypothetical protein